MGRTTQRDLGQFRTVWIMEKGRWNIFEQDSPWWDVESFGKRVAKAITVYFDYIRHPRLIGLIGTHVDDDLVTGTPEFFEHTVTYLSQRFKFKWKRDGFQLGKKLDQGDLRYTGLDLGREQDGSVTLNQQSYILGIDEIPIRADRRVQKDADATPWEVSKRR